jgi:phosphoglucosamine mutase
MAILGTRLLARQALPQTTMVATVMSNLGLERALAASGGKLLRTAVGDATWSRPCASTSSASAASSRGTSSSSITRPPATACWPALQVLTIMVQEGKPLSELARTMTRYPQVLLNFKVAQKLPLEDCPGSRRPSPRRDRAGRDGRVVVRYSGTEAKARVMIEGTDEQLIKSTPTRSPG